MTDNHPRIHRSWPRVTEVSSEILLVIAELRRFNLRTGGIANPSSIGMKSVPQLFSEVNY